MKATAIMSSQQKQHLDRRRKRICIRFRRIRKVELFLFLDVMMGLVSLSLSFVVKPRPNRLLHQKSKILQPTPSCQLFASSSADTDNSMSSFESLEDLRANARIVLVDDEESIRTAVSRLFASRGYQHVTTCEDGQQVLDMLEASADETANENMGDTSDDNLKLSSSTSLPDCIVSDIRMPHMDGLELLGRIRSHPTWRKIPVILLTAKGLTQDRIAGYDRGADAYLAKPFQPDELLAIVETVIQRNALWTTTASAETATLPSSVKVEDLQQDLDTIKDLLVNQGGAGIGNGFVDKDSNVFFSADEQTILELLAEGCVTKEIAAQTHMSTRQIEKLLTQMFRKVNVKNRTELIKWAVSTGHVE